MVAIMSVTFFRCSIMGLFLLVWYISAWPMVRVCFMRPYLSSVGSSRMMVRMEVSVALASSVLLYSEQSNVRKCSSMRAFVDLKRRSRAPGSVVASFFGIFFTI